MLIISSKMEYAGDMNRQGEEVKRMVMGSFIILLCVIALSSPVWADQRESLICRGGLVTIGDTVGEVISKCGEPTYSSSRNDKRIEADSRYSRDRTVTTIRVDDWIYNFGPNQFQYQVIFENGRAARFESLGYGY